MDAANKKLKKVPAVNMQELLIYLSNQEPAVPVKLTTQTGYGYLGHIVSVGSTNAEGGFITIELINDRGVPLDNFIYLHAHRVESVEIFGADNAVNALSLGKMQSGFTYDESGKLDVKRAFKLFGDTIQNEAQINIGAPEMELPGDGRALTRIIKLTGIIQQVIVDLLKSEDARVSWQQKYNKVAFINAADFEVTGKEQVLQIHFPFNDIESLEIQSAKLTSRIMSVL